MEFTNLKLTAVFLVTQCNLRCSALLNAYKFGLTAVIILTLLYAFQSFYPDYMTTFSNTVFLSITGAAVVSSGFALHKYKHDSREFHLVWFCFTGGMIFWFLGELGWVIYTSFLGVEVPYPSIADVFWLAGYVPFFMALYLYVKMFASSLSKRTLGLIMTASIALSVLVTVGLIIPIVGLEEDMVTLAVDFAYPLLDITLFSASLLGLAVFSKGTLGKSWLFINVGMLITAGADMIFSYATAQGTYYIGHVSDLLYGYGYILFALAFYVHTKEL